MRSLFVVFVITVVAGIGYRVLSALQAARRLDARLAIEIRDKLSFLFAEYGFHIVPNEDGLPNSMDAAKATIEGGNVRLRFLTGRGDLTVDVSPRYAPTDLARTFLGGDGD